MINGPKKTKTDHKPSSSDTKVVDLDLKQITELIENLELRNLKNDFLAKLSFLVIAVLGFIVAISWQEALKFTFSEYFGKANNPLESFYYPIAITLCSLVISIFVSKYFTKKLRQKKHINKR